MVTYGDDVQPLLLAKCGQCHSASATHPLSTYFFADSYTQIQRTSKLCEGQQVAVCVGLAIEHQEMEAEKCRTYLPPFHRDAWICLTQPERALVANWIASGTPE